MYNTMIGKYIPVNSMIHNMNAISKIICLLLFLGMLIINDVILLSMLTALTITMVILSKVPLKLYLKSISGLKVLIIFIIVLNFIFGGSWYITISTVIKIILGVVYTMILTYTTSKSEITYGLEKVFKPLMIFKVPVKQLALSLTLALRFIPSIFEQTEKIMKSQASRGIDFNHSNLKGKVIAVSSMMVPMFILTNHKSDVLAEVMEVRLYSNTVNRTNYRFSKWRGFDDNIVLLHFGIFLYFILKIIWPVVM